MSFCPSGVPLAVAAALARDVRPAVLSAFKRAVGSDD
jgi:hypothetical protein